MTCSKSIPSASVTLQTYSTTAQFVPTSRWMPVTGLSTLDFAMRISNLAGSIEVKPAVQMAEVRPDSPNAATAITAGAYQAADGIDHFQETVTGSTKLLYRVGVMHKLSTGSSLGSAEIVLDAAQQLCGQTLRQTAVPVNPGQISGTDINYAELSGWLPAVGLDKIKAAFMVVDNESDYLEYQLVIRSAVDRRQPNAWQTAEASWTNPSSTNTERNTAELSVPAGASITSNQFFQLGVAFRKKSGAGGNPRASILATPAVKYA